MVKPLEYLQALHEKHGKARFSFESDVFGRLLDEEADKFIKMLVQNGLANRAASTRLGTGKLVQHYRLTEKGINRAKGVS